MFMSAMVQIFSWGERWHVPFFASLNGTFHLVPLHEWENIHYLSYITCTKIQILKQI